MVYSGAVSRTAGEPTRYVKSETLVPVTIFNPVTRSLIVT
jgi:hypothetical protein